MHAAYMRLTLACSLPHGIRDAQATASETHEPQHPDRACGRAGFLYEHGIEDDQFPVAKNMQRANAFYALCAAQVPCVSLVLAEAPVV